MLVSGGKNQFSHLMVCESFPGGIANANGYAIFWNRIESDEPVKPDLKTIQINEVGVFYTTKLAFHYFNKQPETEDRERCIIMTASLAGFVDLPNQVEYTMSKFALRGLMRSLRRTSWVSGIRVNIIAPW
jgi:NAD(P)-dependent dehydrogenase (short-subunit alcohol dehydrogenase family)